MGDDSAVVQAARTSYGKGTKTVSEDRGLIRYLMSHWHTTPFEMCEIKIHIRIPMDAWRQMIRHRTASVNEYSTRYSEAIDSRAITEIGQWRFQSKSNKQGSSGFLPINTEFVEGTEEGDIAQLGGDYLSTRELEFHELSGELYQERLDAGVAREVARKDLPLSTYTEAYWKVDLHNLFHFLRLRLDTHAQLEIREFAQAIANIAKDWVPSSWEAFEDYRLHSCTFSRMEMSALRDLISDPYCFDAEMAQDSHVAVPVSILDASPQDRKMFLESHGLTNQRERIEFWKKLKG